MQQTRTQRATIATTARKSKLSRDHLTAIIMVIPSLVAIAVFVYGFIAWTGYVSFSRWNQLKPDLSFAGFANYQAIFTDGRFQGNIRNLIVFTFFFLLICLCVGLGLALMVDARVKGESFFRSVYLFPMAVSFIVTGVAWNWIFRPGDQTPLGLNQLFHLMGLDFLQAKWISDSRVVPNKYPGGLIKTAIGIPLAMLPVVIAAVWQMAGFTMAMYLAGLRGISEEIKEAARVDGASEWTVFRYMILPQLRPVTLSAVIILAHTSLKIFDLIVSMTGGGPGNKTEVPGLYMFDLTFNQDNRAEGAAVAMIMLLLISLLIIPYLRYNRRQEVEA